MESDIRQHLIHGAFVKLNLFSIMEPKAEFEIIELLQLYLNQNIIYPEDLRTFLFTQKYIPDNLRKWIIEQCQTVITNDDIQLLLNDGLIPDPDSYMYGAYVDLIDNIPIEEVKSIKFALKRFTGDKLISCLRNISLSDIIQFVKDNERSILSEHKDHIAFCKEHIFDRIDEIKHITDMDTIIQCMHVVGVIDPITQQIETAIRQNKYYVFHKIVHNLTAVSYNPNSELGRMNFLINGWVGTYNSERIVNHIIDIYEQITGELLELGNDKYSTYIGCMCADTKHIGQFAYNDAYTTVEFQKIFRNVWTFHISRRYDDDVVGDSLIGRMKLASAAWDNLIKNKFVSVSVLEEEADKFEQLSTDIVQFMHKKLN